MESSNLSDRFRVWREPFPCSQELAHDRTSRRLLKGEHTFFTCNVNRDVLSHTFDPPKPQTLVATTQRQK